MDAGKSPVRRGLLEYFPRACMAVADISASGAQKYAWAGWESVPDGVARYGDAEARHICKQAIEGPIDQDYGHLHAAHEAWNAMARLELILREMDKNPTHHTIEDKNSAMIQDIAQMDQLMCHDCKRPVPQCACQLLPTCPHLRARNIVNGHSSHMECSDCGAVF
jgi:hypothetical protein